jgi:hypothetical protein
LGSRHGIGDETKASQCRGPTLRCEKHSQKERLHHDSQRAHRAAHGAIASGSNAQAFDKQAFDKQAFDKAEQALSQRHGSGSRRARRLDPPVRGRASASLRPERILCRSIAVGAITVGERAKAGSCVLAGIGIAYCRRISGEPTPSKSGGLCSRSKRLAVTRALPEGPVRRSRDPCAPVYRWAPRATRYAEIAETPQRCGPTHVCVCR